MKQLIIGLASSLALTMSTAVWAQHGCGMSSGGHDHGSKADAQVQSQAWSGTHGGCSAATKAHHFEVVYLVDGIRVYTYDAKRNPVSAAGVNGRVTLSFDDDTSDTLALAYTPAQPLGDETDNEMHDYLFAPYDLTDAKPASFQAKLSFSNLPRGGETDATFLQTFAGVTQRPFMCAMHPDVWGESAQSKCPLCGMKTTDRRPAVAGPQEPESGHKAGHGHGR